MRGGGVADILLRGGFLAPVSGGDFPISVSAVQRPVRLLTETGSAKEAKRPSRMPSIHPRAVAIAASRASRLSGLIAGFVEGA
jgi:hypothetical protein